MTHETVYITTPCDHVEYAVAVYGGESDNGSFNAETQELYSSMRTPMDGIIDVSFSCEGKWTLRCRSKCMEHLNVERDTRVLSERTFEMVPDLIIPEICCEAMRESYKVARARSQWANDLGLPWPP